MRPAWPTSCCSSSVAPRMPLCISVRFQMVFWELDIWISAVVTMLETMSSKPVAMSSSISEKPAALRSVLTGGSKLRRLERHNGRRRVDLLAKGSTDGRHHGNAFEAGRRRGRARCGRLHETDFPHALVVPVRRRG